MRILLVFSFILTLQAPVTSWANTGAIKGCIRALENLAGIDYTTTHFTREQAESIVKSKTPEIVWFEETNFEFAPESAPAVLFAKKFIDQKLKDLSWQALKTGRQKKNQKEMIEILRDLQKLASQVVTQNYPFKKTACLMAAFSFIVDYAEKYDLKENLKDFFEQEVAFTVQEELNLANLNTSHTDLLGIKPRIVYTTKPIDEIDLILSAYAGVFYIEKSPKAHNIYDTYQDGRGSLDKASHDMFHAQSKITSITSTSPVFQNLTRIFYASLNLKSKQTLRQEFRPIMQSEFEKQIALAQEILIDALTLKDIKLRSAIILALFQQSHENANYISDLVEAKSYQIHPPRLFERYEKGEYDHRFSSLNLKLEDFEGAQTWVLNRLKEKGEE